jgi:hypothetical protein
MGESDVTTRDLAGRSSEADVSESENRDYSSEADHEPLLPSDQATQYASSWEQIQARFVDQPRESVEAADRLVADLMQRLAASFSEEREQLENQWDSGDDVSTEDLRVTLTRYRSFFNRLLSA